MACVHRRVQQGRSGWVISKLEENWWMIMAKLVDWPLRAMLKKWNEKARRTTEKWWDNTDSTDTSWRSVHKILQQNLELKKECSKLVLKVLIPEKKERVFFAETFLKNCEEDTTLFGWIITGDESWVFKYDLSTTCQSMQWKKSDETRHKKARTGWSQQKLMLTLFFDVQGVVWWNRCHIGKM